jgi:glutamyl-tRNA synthetase
MNDLDLKIENPRVRIAPSPTGPLHIGTARTALFNYLFAKRYGGKFILRIEDTDVERSTKEWENDLIESLIWLGIVWDEGPDPENPENYLGEYGPYRQSERRKIYEKYIKKLLDEGKAYYCFCTKEELEAKKQYFMSIGEAPKYNGKCRNLTKAEVEKYLSQGKPSVIRFKIPAKKVVFKDLIHGKIEVDSSLLGDMVVAKDASSPLYNLAAVIDDYEMKITHVIRGEDHLSNTPKQILLQEALGIDHPQYAHLPLILGPDRSKLSKRHGSVALREYRAAGYLPEALINFMAFLGWNPGTDREIYSLNSLIKEFSLENCQKSPAVFNERKLIWINGFYIRQKNIRKLTELCLPYLIEARLIEPVIESQQYPPVFGSQIIKHKFIIPETKEAIDINYLEKVISLYQERLKVLSEITELVDFFFKKKLEYPKDLLKWKDMDDNQLIEALSKLEGLLSGIEESDWSEDKLKEVLLPEAETFGKEGDRGYLLWPLRVALSGKEASAGPFEIAVILGKEKTLSRIKEAQKIAES